MTIHKIYLLITKNKICLLLFIFNIIIFTSLGALTEKNDKNGEIILIMFILGFASVLLLSKFIFKKIYDNKYSLTNSLTFDKKVKKLNIEYLIFYKESNNIEDKKELANKLITNEVAYYALVITLVALLMNIPIKFKNLDEFTSTGIIFLVFMIPTIDLLKFISTKIELIEEVLEYDSKFKETFFVQYTTSVLIAIFSFILSFMFSTTGFILVKLILKGGV